MGMGLGQGNIMGMELGQRNIMGMGLSKEILWEWGWDKEILWRDIPSCTVRSLAWCLLLCCLGLRHA